MLPSPLTMYIAGGAAIAAGIAGFTVRGWQCDAAYSKALEQAAQIQQEMQSEIDERSRAYEAARNQADGLASSRRTDIRTIYRDVPAPPVSCAAPDNVVSVLQSGINSANAATAGEPGNPVSSTKRRTTTSNRSREKSVGVTPDS
jgi:hypothetical protein